ncbi:hypothetical protein HmCmsJML037_04288 [Escherichia coli]|nr:hypothetical protein HmCmsJML037_04288 [Escherichia coli]
MLVTGAVPRGQQKRVACLCVELFAETLGDLQAGVWQYFGDSGTYGPYPRVRFVVFLRLCIGVYCQYAGYYRHWRG